MTVKHVGDSEDCHGGKWIIVMVQWGIVMWQGTTDRSVEHSYGMITYGATGVGQ